MLPFGKHLISVYNTDDLDHPQIWQQRSGGAQGQRSVPPTAASSSVSAGLDQRGWSIPIKYEGHQNEYSSPKSRSYGLETQNSQSPQSVVPPPRDFASGRTDLPREIPVVFEGLSQGLRNLRQVPVEVESRQSNVAGQANVERGVLQEIPIDRSEGHGVQQHGGQGYHQGQQVQQQRSQGQSGRREIPIKVVAGFTPGQTSVANDVKLESPKPGQSERDRKKADLEKRRIDLERDINNVIYEAIKQVPVYNKPSQPAAPGPKKEEPVREKMADDGAEEVFEQQQIADRKQAMQTFWEALEQNEKTSRNQQPGSYSTLPVRKRTLSDERKPKWSFEAEAGSYATLPSFGHKKHESPKPPRRVLYDDIDHSFSDIEGGRGKAQPSWRPPESPLQSRHIWKPIIPPREASLKNTAPPESPGLQRRGQPEPPPPRHHGQPVTPSVTGLQGHPVQQQAPMPSGKGFIPIPIQYEQKPRKGNSHLHWHVIAW